jgi:N-acetylmuramoyl-L-alanine amidase CwlA
MTKRNPKKQSQHNAKVKQIANRLNRNGWNVHADIPGYVRPDPIGKNNLVPDITAQKSGAKKIIEVETPETMEKDKKQHETFRRSASHKKRTKFEIEKT